MTIRMTLNNEGPRPGTRVATVMAAVRARTADRSLGPGARVPSIRRMAETLRVSPSTVVEAYDRLAAEGEIQPRRGSGFYVTRRTRPFALLEAGSDPGLRKDRAVDPHWIMRQSLESDQATLRPGCGWLPSAWMMEAELRRALQRIARDPAAAIVDYDTPLGFPALRALLVRRLAERGIEAPPGQVMLTDSGSQAIDLVCRFLIEPGDAVLVDDPCYFNFIAVLHAHRARIVGVPFTPSGPDMAAFEAAVTAHRPRLYLTNAALHNPTGATVGTPVLHRLLKLAEAHDFVILEDDIFADLEPEPVPRLAALDGLRQVIHVASFSKTLSAGMRCGYIAARADWVEGIADLKLATQFGNGAVAARAIHRLLLDGSYRRHVDRLRARLLRAMGMTARRLESAGLALWTEPRGGMFLWAQLPEGLDSADLARRALDRGIVLAPGNVFSPSGSAGRNLRFNAAQCASPRIFDFLAASSSA
jgi:DNA-binding transcriptional MocR family regulator